MHPLHDGRLFTRLQMFENTDGEHGIKIAIRIGRLEDASLRQIDRDLFAGKCFGHRVTMLMNVEPIDFIKPLCQIDKAGAAAVSDLKNPGWALKLLLLEEIEGTTMNAKTVSQRAQRRTS